jgi:hypothetical protein
VHGAGVRAVVAAVAATLLLAGCVDDNASLAPQPFAASDRANGFLLSLTLPTNTFTSSQPIDLEATLTWEGDAAIRKVWASAAGPLVFTAKQLDGPREIGGGSDAACAVHEFERGVPQRSGYQKSGGYSETDPDAAFYKAFFADPQFRLPPGQWRIGVTADGYLEECALEAPRLALRVAADVLVR